MRIFYQGSNLILGILKRTVEFMPFTVAPPPASAALQGHSSLLAHHARSSPQLWLRGSPSQGRASCVRATMYCATSRSPQNGNVCATMAQPVIGCPGFHSHASLRSILPFFSSRFRCLSRPQPRHWHQWRPEASRQRGLDVAVFRTYTPEPYTGAEPAQVGLLPGRVPPSICFGTGTQGSRSRRSHDTECSATRPSNNNRLVILTKASTFYFTWC